jgi:hypothetical protein
MKKEEKKDGGEIENLIIEVGKMLSTIIKKLSLKANS